MRAQIIPSTGNETLSQWRILSIYVILFLVQSLAHAEDAITSSGFNTVVEMPSGTTQEIQIRGGTRRGDNLFHSFGAFSIGEKQIANFVNDQSGGFAHTNILARVTGKDASRIEGTIRTSNFDSADLYLFNPHGIFFGPQANLDVTGSFHVGSAHFIELEDNQRVYADPGKTVTLSSAEPAAFGFLTFPTGILTVHGSTLQVPEEEDLSITGSDIVFEAKSTIGGQGNAIKVRASNLLLQDGSAITTAASGTVRQPGDITISVTGAVTITGFDRFREDTTPPSTINSSSSGRSGGDISITASKISMSEHAVIRATSSGADEKIRGGNIVLEAKKELLITGSSRVTSEALGINGESGDISLKSSKISIRNGGQILATTQSTGEGGTIDINAQNGRIIIIGKDDENQFSSIRSEAKFPGGNNAVSRGDAGDINIYGEGLNIGDGAEISTTTFSTGKGGNILIKTNDLTLSNQGRVSAQSKGLTVLKNGEPFFISEGVELKNGNNLKPGTSGEINIAVKRSILVENDSHITIATSQATAGSINVDVGKLLSVRNDSSVNTSAGGGVGDGGDIFIGSQTAPDILILGNGSKILAKAKEGVGGKIGIKTRGLIRAPSSEINASSERGIDGEIEISTPDADVTAGTLPLESGFADLASLLSERCAARKMGRSSSFVVREHQGLSVDPDQLLPKSAVIVNGLAKSSELHSQESDSIVAVFPKKRRYSLNDCGIY